MGFVRFLAIDFGGCCQAVLLFPALAWPLPDRWFLSNFIDFSFQFNSEIIFWIYPSMQQQIVVGEQCLWTILWRTFEALQQIKNITKLDLWSVMHSQWDNVQKYELMRSSDKCTNYILHCDHTPVLACSLCPDPLIVFAVHVQVKQNVPCTWSRQNNEQVNHDWRKVVVKALQDCHNKYIINTYLVDVKTTLF